MRAEFLSGPSQFGSAPARFGRRRHAEGLGHAQELQLAEVRRSDHVSRAPVHVHEPVLVIDDHATRALAGERDDRVGLLQTWHERLLAQHVRTGLQGVAHQCEMRVGRRGDDDDIGSGCPQQRREIRKERKAEVGVRRNRIGATDDRDPIEPG